MEKTPPNIEGSEERRSNVFDLRHAPNSEIIALLRKGQEDESTNDLSQGEVDVLVERVAIMYSKGEIDWSEAGHLFMPHAGVGGEKHIQGQTITTRAFRSVFNVASKHATNSPEDLKIIDGLRQIDNIIGQNPQMIHPRNLLEIAVEVRANPQIPSYLADGIYHSLGYALRFFSNADYEAVIKERLDFKHKENFFQTANFLEMMRVLYNMGDKYSYGDNIVTSRIHNAISESIKANEGSYLLNARAKQLLDTMDGREHIWNSADVVPFEITKGRYAFDGPDGLRIAKENETTEIQSDIRHVQAIENAMRKSGKTTWRMTDPQIQMRKQLYIKLQSIGRPFDINDLGFQINKKLEREMAADYRYLISAPIRNLIKDDFNVDIATLSLTEQFYFLNFLKTVDGSARVAVQDFTSTFVRDGIRTFLAASVDPKISDEILAFAKTGNPEQVRSVFASFGELADQVEELQGYLEKEFGIKESATIQNITEKLLHRGRDLLVQANKYSNNPEKLRELIQARSAKGQLLLSVYRALKDQKSISKLSDLEGVHYEQIPGNEVLQDETTLQQLEALYRRNHPKDAGDGLVARFKDNLANSSATLHRITFKNKLVAFMLVNPLTETRVHASALNVDQEFAGAQVGPELLGRLINMARAGTTVEIEALPRLASQYEKQYGFVKTGEEIDPADGETVFKLELRPLS